MSTHQVRSERGLHKEDSFQVTLFYLLFSSLFLSSLHGGEMGVFSEVVSPILGICLCNSLYLSSFKAVRICRSRGHLGSVNPIPWCASPLFSLFLFSPFISRRLLSLTTTQITRCLSLVMCVGWTVYSFLLQDFYLLASAVRMFFRSIFKT